MAVSPIKQLIMTIYIWLNKGRLNSKGLSPIMFRITIYTQRATFSTSLFIEEELWDAKMQCVKKAHSFSVEYNEVLNSLKSKAYQLYSSHLQNNKEVSAIMIRDLLMNNPKKDLTFLNALSFHLQNLKSRLGFDIALNTVKKYETAERKLRKFLKDKGRDDIFLSELSPKFITEFDLYMRITEKLKHNAIIKNMQQFHRVIQVSIDNGWLQKDPFEKYSFKTDDTERGYLTAAELKVMETVPLLSKRLEHVRDIFVFCCYTGLAFADVSKLNRMHFEQDANGINWIRINRTKSKTRASIPVLPKAQGILDKYAPMTSKGLDKPILPVISNQNLNKYLKEIAAFCGIKKRISMHLARHTFATTVTLEQGVDISTVSKMLGHKNVKTTQIYAKVTELKIAEDMKKLLDKPT